MGGKFLVLKFKDIVKTAVFAVIGILFFAAVIYFAFGRGDAKPTAYVPGTYSSQIELSEGRMTVEVKVGKNKIKSVSVTNESETIPVFYPLFESASKEIGKKVVKEQSTDISLETGSPMTEKMLLEAVEKNLEKARQNAGENT